MLDHLGHSAAADDVMAAIERALAESFLRTRDLGGAAETVTCGKAVVDAFS
jgi:tartrate dehydrogenase/decarboxylase/D-malate dehydrogenase